MRRPPREIQIFSLSALDLFASAMGTFIVIAVMLFPYYLKTTKTKVRIPGIDVVYVIDTTASMGEGVNQVRSSLAGVVAVLEKMAPSVRVGFVAYKARDGRGNDYVMIFRDLASTKQGGLLAMRRWVIRLNPQGGGTEIMLEAVRKAESMKWRSGAMNVIVVVADEPGSASELSALVALARRFGGPRRKISAFLPPAGALRGMSPQQLQLLRRQRVIVRRWMKQITTAGNGIFVPPDEGDLASATLLTVLEQVRP